MDYTLHLENQLLFIKGATKVVSSTSTGAQVLTEANSIIITGQNIEVKKLNLDDKEVCFYGEYTQIKFSGSVKKQPLLKRIFK